MSEEQFKVKMFRVLGNHCYDCGGNEYAVGCSDWQTLNAEEYQLLTEWVEYENSHQHIHDYVIVQDMDMNTIQHHIGDMRVIIAERRRIKKEKAVESEKKRVERMLRKQAKDEAEELALLKKLQEKHGKA